MAKIEIKQPIVEEISAGIKDAQSVVLVDYRGLTVEEDTELRKQLRAAGVVYKVYKNTMIRLAAKGTEFEALSPALEGPTALAVHKTDAAVPAKVLYEFAKKNPQLELKAGVVDGSFYDSKTINVIATIPGRNELLGRLFGSMKGSISGFARVLNQIAEQKAEA